MLPLYLVSSNEDFLYTTDSGLISLSPVCFTLKIILFNKDINMTHMTHHQIIHIMKKLLKGTLIFKVF